MQCPKCKGKDTEVYTTIQEDAMTFRLRACAVCGHRFRTVEEYLCDVKAQQRTLAKFRPMANDTKQLDWTETVQ